LVRAAHYFYCACGYADGVPHADEYSPYDADAPDEELEEGCGSLVLCYCEWVKVEFEEDAWGALVMLHYARVVRYAVLVRLEGRGTGGDIGCRDDV
jgi:hypothetical protein